MGRRKVKSKEGSNEVKYGILLILKGLRTLNLGIDKESSTIGLHAILKFLDEKFNFPCGKPNSDAFEDALSQSGELTSEMSKKAWAEAFSISNCRRKERMAILNEMEYLSSEREALSLQIKNLREQEMKLQTGLKRINEKYDEKQRALDKKPICTEDNYISVDEAAKYICHSTRSFMKLVLAGKIRYFQGDKGKGFKLMFRIKDLDEYMDTFKHEAKN